MEQNSTQIFFPPTCGSPDTVVLCKLPLQFLSCPFVSSFHSLSKARAPPPSKARALPLSSPQFLDVLFYRLRVIHFKRDAFKLCLPDAFPGFQAVIYRTVYHTTPFLLFSHTCTCPLKLSPQSCGERASALPCRINDSCGASDEWMLNLVLEPRNDGNPVDHCFPIFPMMRLFLMSNLISLLLQFKPKTPHPQHSKRRRSRTPCRPLQSTCFPAL